MVGRSDETRSDERPRRRRVVRGLATLLLPSSRTAVERVAGLCDGGTRGVKVEPPHGTTFGPR